MITGKQAADWAKAIAILGGLLLGGYSTWVKGEPGAKLAYKELARSFNELRTEFLQQKAYNEGFLAGFTQPLPPQEPQPVSPTPAAPDAAVATAEPEPDAAPPAPAPPPRRPASAQKLPRALPPQLEQLKKEF